MLAENVWFVTFVAFGNMVYVYSKMNPYLYSSTLE